MARLKSQLACQHTACKTRISRESCPLRFSSYFVNQHHEEVHILTAGLAGSVHLRNSAALPEMACSTSIVFEYTQTCWHKDAHLLWSLIWQMAAHYALEPCPTLQAARKCLCLALWRPQTCCHAAQDSFNPCSTSAQPGISTKSPGIAWQMYVHPLRAATHIKRSCCISSAVNMGNVPTTHSTTIPVMPRQMLLCNDSQAVRGPCILAIIAL